MSFSLTDEQYARTRISESPLSKVFHSKNKSHQESSVSTLNSHAYKNIQTVVAQLIILSASDNEDVSLQQIAEIISIEARNIAMAGIDYAYNVVATAQQEEDQLEIEFEEEDKDPEAGDWRDREEDREEETHAANQTGNPKSLN